MISLIHEKINQSTDLSFWRIRRMIKSLYRNLILSNEEVVPYKNVLLIYYVKIVLLIYY